MNSRCFWQSFNYVIQPGDTFFKLAQQFNTSVNAISAVNPGISSNSLTIGQTICIPATNPEAAANITGGPLRPQINGVVQFFNVPGGTLVCAEVNGLPPYQPASNGEDPIGPHGFHIHEFGNCEAGDPQDPFRAAGGHWNPDNQPHGNHAGDFPVLFSNQGVAKMCFFTNSVIQKA